jgi:hypothetical protein
MVVPAPAKWLGKQRHSAGGRARHSRSASQGHVPASNVMLVALAADIVVAPSLVPILMWSSLTGGSLEFASSGLVMLLLVVTHLAHRITSIRSKHPQLQGSWR